MASNSWCLLALSLCAVSACSDDGGDATQHESETSADGGSKTSSKPSKGDAGATGSNPTGSNPTGSGTSGTGNGQTNPDQPVGTNTSVPTKCDYEKQTVEVTKDLVIAAGETVHVCPGTTFHVSGADTKIDVLGKLVVDGSSDSEVSFLGGGAPNSWHGIVIEAGGSLALTHAKVADAKYGMFAMPGSSYAVEASQFATSFKAAVLQSNGTFSHTKFEASVPPTIAVTDAVSVDDPNGAVTIMDASPSFTNCAFDGAWAFTDVVRVGGESSSTFDHVHLSNAHCGFHTSGGTNTSIHVTNAIFEGLAYGIMAYATKPIIEDSVFMNNSNDVGVCTGATADNTPVLMNNFYAKGMPTVDASCFRIGTKEDNPAMVANPAAGPTGI